MGDRGFLYMLLDKVQSHSTVIGKIWMRGLFILRTLVLGAGAAIVWGDEQFGLVCNTQQPGCKNMCYDWKFPISHMHFWMIQLIFVSMPMLLHLCHVVHVVHQENNFREGIKQQHDNPMTTKPKYTDAQGHMKIQGILFGSYLTHLFFKIIFEVVFIIGQYYLYDFIMSPHFTCSMFPCPNAVDCYISHPTEKNILSIFMLVVACVSVLLSVMEVFFLLFGRCCPGKGKNNTSAEHPTSPSWQLQLGAEDPPQNKMI